MNVVLLLLAIFVVGLQFLNHWNLSKGNLKLAYPLIILIAISNIIVDVYLTFIHPEQFGVLVYTFANIWAIWMAWKGMKRIKDCKEEHK